MRSVATSNAKRHHQIPIFYMMRFSPDGKSIFVFDRIKRTTRSTDPKNVAVEKEFYTVINRSGKKERWAEARLADLESAAKLALEKLEAGKDLSREERWCISFFVGLAETRGRGFREEAKKSGSKQKYDDDMSSWNRFTPRLSAEEKKKFEDAYHAVTGLWVDGDILLRAWYDEIAEIKEGGADLAAMASGGFELAPRIFYAWWGLVHAPQGVSFVTSDRPLGLWRLNSGLANNPKEQGILRIFPVSTTKALVIGDPVNEPFVLQQDFDATQVLLVNATIAKRSHRFVIGSSELFVKLAVIGAFKLPTEPLKKNP